MTRHQASGRFGLGLSLAGSTMILWGVLPLILEGVLGALDPVTITWFRFGFSAVVLGVGLAWRRSLPSLRSLERGKLGLLGVATLFLAANYLGYLLGLDSTDAATAQVLIQAAPLLLAVGGIFVFRERFERLQWIGLAVLVTGMGIFFAGQLRSLVEGLDRYLSGAAWIGFAAVTWAVYGLAQKQLLLWLPSQGIMLCIYTGSAILFSFGAHPTALAGLDRLEWLLLLFASANTLVAYGTFAAALEHWEASKVSAVLALTPLATLAFAAAAAALWPDQVSSRPVGASALAGAAIVVGGSLLISLGQRRALPPPDADGSG
jgi:drug/metabolite transporter (DMT)-like permease